MFSCSYEMFRCGRKVNELNRTLHGTTRLDLYIAQCGTRGIFLMALSHGVVLIYGININNRISMFTQYLV